ncbi:MAG: xanthine dehydrogenase family protein molybdopterin-binding subunit, partial [Candidatus Binatia bacterium]
MATAQAFGASVKRVEDPRFLTGQAEYVEGLRLPNTLSVAFVRSPYAHARIKSIDARKALAHPGVHRVLTGEEAKKLCKAIRVEVPPGKFPGAYKACDFPAIAVGKALFVGDLVAAVVADNR